MLVAPLRLPGEALARQRSAAHARPEVVIERRGDSSRHEHAASRSGASFAVEPPRSSTSSTSRSVPGSLRSRAPTGTRVLRLTPRRSSSRPFEPNSSAGLDNAEVVKAGFLTYEHQGRPADVIYSRYALQHIPDFWKGVALARLHAALS